MRLRRRWPVLVVLPALAACTALAGLEPLSFSETPDASPDQVALADAPGEASPVMDGGADGGDSGVDAKPTGSGHCASLAPAFAEDFSAFDGGGWTIATSGSCSASNRAFPAGPQGLCAELMCTANASEAYTILQVANAVAENVHIEAELLVSIDPAAPLHAFAQAISWVTNVNNLRFFGGPDGVSVHVDNGPALASWKPKPPGFYLLEVQLTRLTEPDGGLAMGRVRVVFDGAVQLFDVPITVGGASQRAPAFQIGPYFPTSPGSTATDRYDSLKLWSCP